MSDLPEDVITSPLYFPELFVEHIATSLQEVLPNLSELIVKRSLSEQDASLSIGVVAERWAADEDSSLIGQEEPAFASYYVRVYNLVKAMSEPTGRALFSNEAKTIRVILARDPGLRVRLTQSSETLLSSIERVKGYKVTGQEYIEGRLGQMFSFLAITRVRIDTNTTFIP